ncbi:hypothetical protein BpHYR1_053180 [Brachionus plicatilis]|uniref:Uncharacterized protein n=1 Tax=Brachionus plicatilis TaxID=10195 RepID=A0A3M7S1X6_BRAPC|nr:hypothetical protein BpHYR1_053180 [Brachionus plicatilis]
MIINSPNALGLYISLFFLDSMLESFWLSKTITHSSFEFLLSSRISNLDNLSLSHRLIPVASLLETSLTVLFSPTFGVDSMMSLELAESEMVSFPLNELPWF